jgi:hypothetical protein
MNNAQLQLNGYGLTEQPPALNIPWKALAKSSPAGKHLTVRAEQLQLLGQVEHMPVTQGGWVDLTYHLFSKGVDYLTHRPLTAKDPGLRLPRTPHNLEWTF